jgi:shikimate dehydrogenase
MTLCTVIGNPVAHSLSPQIHQLFAQQFDLEVRYTRSLSTPARFARTVSEFFRQGGLGANVTVPFKQAAVALCGELSDRAQAAAAVNTLLVGANGKLYGDNTDGVGLVADLQCQLGSLSGRNAVIVGAGGATRGVILPLLQAGVTAITIANRTEAKAAELIGQFNPFVAPMQTPRLHAVALADLSASHCAGAILVNATSAGWSGQQLALNTACLAAAEFVYDMNYGAKPTPFLQQAQCAGAAQYCDGLGMLVQQAAASFALWHGGKTPNTEMVLQQLREDLNN